MVRMMARLLPVLFLLFAAAQGVRAEKRVALVIGNSAYDLAPLTNPKNDADDVSAALKRLQFDVTERKDLAIRSFDQAMDSFETAAKGADVALFFFSGHGLQIDKRGYLAPIDIKAESESSALRELVAIQEVVSRIENAAKVSVIVLDACRDSPLQERLRRISLEKNRDLIPPKGLPPVSVVGSNTLIVYATVPGETASDGAGRNSPFTASLLKNIETPGLEIELLFKRVTAEVLNASHGKQQPERLSRLQDELILLPQVFPRKPGTPLPEMAIAAPPRPVIHPDIAVCEDASPVLAAQSKKCVKPGSGESFKDCPECPEMVVVPSGSFTMGSPPSEPAHLSAEAPPHRVTIPKPFAVGKFAVTFAEWDRCMMGGGCGGYEPDDQGWGRGGRPVINVSWNDAKAYVAWLSKTSGKEYRLLSEAEREYVARAGTATPFWWGSSITPEQANYDGTLLYKGGGRKGEFRRKTVPVNEFSANPWGLYQIHGNVWEWGEDCWNPNYGGAPGDGSAWTSGECKYRVRRGGSWFDNPQALRSAVRGTYLSENREDKIGFRVARTLAP